MPLRHYPISRHGAPLRHYAILPYPETVSPYAITPLRHSRKRCNGVMVRCYAISENGVTV
eukprot:10403599-Karenia_brevis.AAC.1